MKRIYQYLALLLFGTALVAPVWTHASANLSDEPRESKHEKRYYDREHKDYHGWDERENAAYRRWLQEERHENYRSFEKLKREQQNEYWKWRHEHPDNDRDRDRDRH